MPGYVLDLMASEADVEKAPIVHCSQFANAIARGELANQLLDQLRKNSSPTPGRTEVHRHPPIRMR
jgi:hypothetical protein